MGNWEWPSLLALLELLVERLALIRQVLQDLLVCGQAVQGDLKVRLVTRFLLFVIIMSCARLDVQAAGALVLHGQLLEERDGRP